MTDRIEEITKKIYNEGVIKAKNEAKQIIAEAKVKADEIISSAKNVHDQILQDSKKKAEEEKRKAEVEIKLAARQFTSNLKQRITKIITTKQIQPVIKEAFSDKEFIHDIILIVLKNWKQEEADKIDLKVLLPQDKEEELTAFFNSKATRILNKGIELNFDSKLESGFQIGPRDGSYLISFTDRDFENYFTQYFKEKTKKLLFDATGND